MRNFLSHRIFAGPSGGGLAEGRVRRILSVILKIIFHVVVVGLVLASCW